MSTTTLFRRRSLGLRRYAPVLRAPHAISLATGSYVSRAGQAGFTLAVLLAVRHATGSYGAAGTATGFVAVAAAVSRVAQGRLMDRFGQTRVMLPVALLQCVAAGAFAAAAAARASALVLIVLAGILGLSLPAVAAVMRTLWGILLPADELRMVAATMESLVTELAFMTGPALAGVVATAVSPTAAVLAMALFTAAGAAVVATSPPSRDWRPHPRAHTEGGSLLGLLMAPVSIALLIGLSVGTVDVAAPAFATEHHVPGATGALLAVWAMGSLVGGAWYGARHWTAASRERRLVGCVACLALAMALIPLAHSTLGLGGLLILAGLPIAPSLTTIYLLVDERAPRERVTEAFAWVSSSLPGGAALGAVISGWLVSASGPSASFVAGAALCMLAVVAAFLAARSLRREQHAATAAA